MPKSRLVLVFAAAVCTSLLGYLINQLPAIPDFPKKNEWLMGAVGLFTIVAASVALWQSWQEVDSTQDSTVVGDDLTRQAYRNRKALLAKVRTSWIKGVLERSLYAKAKIELGLEERPDIAHSWKIEWVEPEQERRVLPAGTRVINKLNQLGEGATLLILGEPGAGKTTTLLELARDLLAAAEQDGEKPIPVVLNLSSWSRRQGKEQSSGSQTIKNWLIEELQRQYQIPKSLGKAWIEQQELLLLLDGLDEVSQAQRNACVDALNHFRQEHGTIEIVVCSRIKDYEALSSRLRFQAALFIQPLTSEQIEQYLNQAGAELAGVRMALQTDPELQELAQTPLILSIMSLAYQGLTAAQIPQMGQKEWRRHLFNQYIKRMLQRQRGELRYPQEKMGDWLHFLALRLVKESQTVFLIERMQPTWLLTDAQKRVYGLGARLLIVLLGLSAGLSGGLSGGLIFGLIFGLLVGLIFGLSSGLSAGLEMIEPVEVLNWSWSSARRGITNELKTILLVGLIFGLSSGLIFGLLVGLSGGLIFGLSSGLIFGLLVGLSGGLISALSSGLIFGLRASELEEKAYPNEGIWKSTKNFALTLLLAGLSGGLLVEPIVGLLVDLLVGSSAGLNAGLSGGLIFGLGGGLGVGLTFGGKACLQHLVLRLILYNRGYIPWNYARFLDHAADRLILQKVGGGYIFVHRLLMEHFAEMSADEWQRMP